jgi:hypothetical protein
VADGCNGKEPSAIHCEQDAFSITQKEGHYVKEGKLEGALEIRKAKPTVCDRIYWARFTPAQDNVGAFEVTLELNGKRTEPQKSEPQNPSVPAWSVVFFAQKGERLRACVLDVSSQHEACTPIIEAV